MMLIYIAAFAGILGTTVLALVYLADRYEHEPIENIQNLFLLGAIVQLVLLVLVKLTSSTVLWDDPWLFASMFVAGLCLPAFLRTVPEMDERFDGIVYSVAALAGATCIIHLNNLPQLASASPFAAVFDAQATPELRDLLIFVSWPPVAAELGRGLAVLASAVIVGAIIGIAQTRSWPTTLVTLAASIAGLLSIALANTTGWLGTLFLSGASVALAIALKRRSVFRSRPEAKETDALILGFKTVLLVFGIALLALVVLNSTSPSPLPPTEAVPRAHTSTLAP